MSRAPSESSSALDELDDTVDEAIAAVIESLEAKFADAMGEDLRWAVVRSLLHRTIHIAVEEPGVQFCTLAAYLGEMIGHAHTLAHGDDPQASAPHRDVVH